tara:strand:- start:66770 stop:67225 length:456 start_codon:yes stop_codon:yes gene_type:complete
MFYLVAGIPLLAIGWGVVMLNLAMSGEDSLVSDSYYKDGVSYTENQEVHEAAERLQVTGDLVFNTDEIHLDLGGYFDEYPNTLNLQLIHPTLEKRDVTVLLQRLPSGQYAGVNEIELPERRHIWLESPEQGWRVDTTVLIEPGQVVHLQAK